MDYEGESQSQEPAEETSIEEIEACSPKVSGKEMIPVVWNPGTLSWVKADVTWNNQKVTWEQTESDLKWYDYSKNEKKWANIVTVEENGYYTRQYYEQAQAGTEILMQDITSMYVWIPRYEYKNIYYTDSTYQQKSEEETAYVQLDVKFIGVDKIQPDEGYTVNSAFSYKNASNEDVNIEGFWVAKFEVGNYKSKTPTNNIGANYGGSSTNPIVANPEKVTENYLIIKPNITSWRFAAQSSTIDYINQIIQVSSEDVSSDGNEEKDIYGLQSSAEIGLLTTEMWDAVAILAKSEYGNTLYNSDNIYGNFYYQGDGTESICYYTTLTGIVTRINENDYSELTDGNIVHLVKSNKEENTGHIKINNKYNYYEYWTENGKKGSTSSNEYGIYDMVGGAAEYTIDSQANYYLRGGSFWNILETNKEAADISSKVQASNINDANRTYSFRTGLVVK